MKFVIFMEEEPQKATSFMPAERARHILGPDRAILYFVYPHGATEVKRMRLPSNELDERHVADSFDDIHSLEARMAQFYAYSLPVQ